MDARYEALYAAVVRQAFHDVAHHYHHARHMEAAAWLELSGLVDADGTSRYGTPRRQRNGTTTTEDYNVRRRIERAEQQH